MNTKYLLLLFIALPNNMSIYAGRTPNRYRVGWNYNLKKTLLFIFNEIVFYSIMIVYITHPKLIKFH